jgi:hypothetical protein
MRQEVEAEVRRTLPTLFPSPSGAGKNKNPSPSGGGLWWGWCTQCAPYLCLDTFNILQNIVIPEPQNLVTLGFKTLCPLSIGDTTLRVLSAVNLDSEALLYANEIDDILPDGKLPSEFEFTHLAHSQVTPEQALGVGSVASEFARDGARLSG